MTSNIPDLSPYFEQPIKKRRLRKDADIEEFFPVQPLIEKKENIIKNVDNNVLSKKDIHEDALPIQEEVIKASPKYEDMVKEKKEIMDEEKEDIMSKESLDVEPELQLNKEVEDIAINRAFNRRVKCKNRLIGQIENSTAFGTIELTPDEILLRDQTLEYDTKNLKKKDFNTLLSKITNTKSIESISNENNYKEPKEDTLNCEELKNNSVADNNKEVEIEMECKEILLGEKLTYKNVEEDIKIVIIPKEPLLGAVHNRNQLLSTLMGASKKRRSENLTLKSINDMAKTTELEDDKPASNSLLIPIEKVEDSDEEYKPEKGEEQVENEEQVESEELKETRRLIMLEEGDECSLEQDSNDEFKSEADIKDEDINDKDKKVRDEENKDDDNKGKDEEQMNDIEQKEVLVMDKNVPFGTLQSNVEILEDDNSEESKCCNK